MCCLRNSMLFCITGEGWGISLNDDILNVREVCCSVKLFLVEVE